MNGCRKQSILDEREQTQTRSGVRCLNSKTEWLGGTLALLGVCLSSQIAFGISSEQANQSFKAHQFEAGINNLGLLKPVPKKQDLTTYAIEIEAEALTLSTYEVESNSHASGGELVSLLNAADGAQGKASTKFNGPTDNYYILVYYLDENDGQADLSVEVAGDPVDSWTLSQDFGVSAAEPEAYTARRLGPKKIEHGDEIAIKGLKEADENARVDMIQLIPTDDLFQAESAVLAGGVSSKNSEPGFTGSGYVRIGSELKLGPKITTAVTSKSVGGLVQAGAVSTAVNPAVDGFAYQPVPKSITWKVNAAKASDYALEFRYAFGAAASAERPLDLFVNDQLVKEGLPFKGTGLSHRWRTEIMIAKLKKGANSIRLKTTGSGGANIDYLAATPINYLNAMGDVSPHSDPYFPEYGDPGYYSSYYGMVDPGGNRETLNEWLDENDFAEHPNLDRSAEYINANDLGFGREMHCIDNGRSSCYVKNFLDPEGASQFAATVAMERMNNDYGSYVAYFVYDKDGDRINQIPLDSEGPKSVPESCYACHGGRRHGSAFFGGNYLPFDIDALKDWPGNPTRAQQLADFKELNEVVWKDADSQYLANNANLTDLIEGWYGRAPTNAGANYGADRLPRESWRSAPNVFDNFAQAGEEDALYDFLYRDVYGKYCRLCHVAQDLDWQDAKVGDFARAAYSHICKAENNHPRMPHAEVTFNKFNFDKLYTAADARPSLGLTIAGSATIAKHLNTIGKSSAGGNTQILAAGNVNPAIVDSNKFAIKNSKQSAKEMLCTTLQLYFPPGDRDIGEEIYTSNEPDKRCSNCHRVEDGSYTQPDLRCRGAWLRQDLGTINQQQMGGKHLDFTEIAHLSAYFNSFDKCQ